ncbi:Meiotic recombination SPO11 [Hyphodiscus hymeniophilus]|uniref:DNA topoisomerase (ATP-hydrolyzing) n=1 Tax=Hyphodiscus hymeniophilus TaxID=353542 RepID=A0A9P7AUP8_9HELO|nr:Meiotic recombination SPO11 [Hyphodiscus hymeniophilus]
MNNLASHSSDGAVSSSQVPFKGHRTANCSQAGAVVSKIEDIFEKVAQCILDEEKEVSIKIKTRGKQSAIDYDANTGIITSKSTDEMKTVQFPSKSPKEAWKFTAFLRILELSHEALVKGVVTTKRDPELFVKQAVVDRYVDDIAYTLGVERDALNVVCGSAILNILSLTFDKVAAAKGLVAGSFKLTRNDGSVIDYWAESEGMLIANTREIKSLQLQDIRWILVIEKEATFRTLATSRYWSTCLAGTGLMLTAKGYPDIQTRQFLHLLFVHSPCIPIYALVDFDPDGLGILSTYKYGSVALAHENASLAVPSIRWLGVKSSDIVQIAGEEDKTGQLKLSARDRRIAGKMLEKDIFAEEGREAEWRREVQVMLMLNVKAEIQILSSGVGLEKWLDGELDGELLQEVP